MIRYEMNERKDNKLSQILPRLVLLRYLARTVVRVEVSYVLIRLAVLTHITTNSMNSTQCASQLSASRSPLKLSPLSLAISCIH